MDGKTIDELVKYIEGTDKKKTGGGGGKKRAPGRGNPKRRGGASGTA
jgi:protein TIF31